MSDDDIAAMTYEQALGELDTLIQRLEGGAVDLAEAIGCYERGSRLAQRCAELLDSTEQRITQLVVGAGGVFQERPFAPEAHGGGAAEPPAPTVPPPPGAPVRARPARPAPGLFPGLTPAPEPEPGTDIDPDEIPF